MDTDDYPDSSTLSLCEDCAKHESLKKFIRQHAGVTARCGGCLRAPMDVTICDIAQRKRLSYLLRGLIRYYYDEIEYNRHFGGRSPGDLLSGENPILALGKKLIAIGPSWEVTDFLSELAAEPPSPKYDDGIWIYHQNDGWLASAISRSESPILKHLRMRLRKENYFILEPLVRERLAQIGSRIDLTISSGTRFYRARLGVAGYISTFEDFHGKRFPRPYQGDELGAPCAAIATVGRLNRAGVSFLYLASDAHTAACEVRPHPSHLLTIGAFESIRPLRIANFAVDIALFAESDVQLDLFHFVHSIDRAMGLPVLPGATDRYMVTQLIADVLRQLGYDGVGYASSLSDGQNICIFDPGAFVAVAGSAEVLRVEKLAYGLINVDSRTKPGPNDEYQPT